MGWAATTTVLWALGWIVSTLFITTAVDAKFFVFGPVGALTLAALPGLVLHRPLPPRLLPAGSGTRSGHGALAHPGDALTPTRRV